MSGSSDLINSLYYHLLGQDIFYTSPPIACQYEATIICVAMKTIL